MHFVLTKNFWKVYDAIISKHIIVLLPVVGPTKVQNLAGACDVVWVVLETVGGPSHTMPGTSAPNREYTDSSCKNLGLPDTPRESQMMPHPKTSNTVESIKQITGNN
jgi:hypothetical protein